MNLTVSVKDQLYTEILIDFDYSSFDYEWSKNASRSISFTAYRTPFNSFSFDLLNVEGVIHYRGQQYIIKQCTPNVFGNEYAKDVMAMHISYECSNCVNYEVITGSKTYSLEDVLTHAFKGENKGYTYTIKGDFSKAVIENLGGVNALSLINDCFDKFGCIMFADNKKLYFYNDLTFYQPTENIIRYKYNTNEVKVSTDTTSLKTVVKAYGKKKEGDDKNYNKLKTTELSYSGAFIKKGTWYTETVNASYTAALDVKWTGDSLSFKLKTDKMGGLWDVYLDNTKIKQLSCWSATSKTETITLVDKLVKGKHTIKFVFVGDDPNHPMAIVDKTKVIKGKKVKFKEKELSRGYVGSESTDVFTIVANTEGENLYHAVTTYTSPNVGKWGKRYADAISDERFVDGTSLNNYAASMIQDDPVVSVSVSYQGDQTSTERDMWHLYHEVLQFDTSLKIVSLKQKHPLINSPQEMTFSNAKKDIVKLQRSLYKNMKNINKTSIYITNALSNIQSNTGDIGFDLEEVGEVDG